MTLSEWIGNVRDISDEQIIDVLAQLLAISSALTEKLSARDISIDFPNGSKFGSLSHNGVFSGHESGVEPPPYDNGNIPAGNVYVCALLLYKILYKELPHDHNARVQRAAVAAGSGEDSPVLSSDDPRFGKFIEMMTEISAEKRIDAMTALDHLSKLRESSALVVVTEEETGAVLDSFSVTLDSAAAHFEPLGEYIFDGQSFFPADKSGFDIPYRVPEIRYTFKVTAAEHSTPRKTGKKPVRGTVCIGIDLGACSTEISFLDENGLLSDIAYEGRVRIPSAAAVTSDGRTVFGREAEELCDKSGAELIRPFAVGDVREKEAVGFDAAVGGFLGYIRQIVENSIGKDKAVTAGIVLPHEDEDPRSRKAVGDAVKNFGWSVFYSDSVTAVYTYYREIRTASDDENTLVLDMGENAVSIGLFTKPPQQTFSAYTAGGRGITELIADKLFRDLLPTGIDLFGEDGNMSTGMLIRGRRAVFEAAEYLKKRLSFDTSAEYETVLPLPEGEKPFRIKLSVDELYNVFNSVGENIKKAMTVCLRNANIYEDEVDHILITGASSVIPSIKELLKKRSPDARLYFSHDSVSVSRGAALYACSKRGAGEAETAERSAFDYGIQKVNAADNKLYFECLLKAGTMFSVDDTAQMIYRLEAGKNDIEGNNFVLKLYSRPQGMEHVRSTLSPENVIKYIGKAVAAIPEKYDPDKDAVDFIINISPSGTVTASAEQVRKARLLSKFTARPTRGNMEIIAALPTEFIAAERDHCGNKR